MSNSSFFGYSYFSGANCYVKINGIPALEMAGISYQVQESTQPIFGYSSRIFDAVAMGQKIVRGNFVINFIAPNYIARIIDTSRAQINLQAIESQYAKYGDGEIDTLVSGSDLNSKIEEQEALRTQLKAQLEASYALQLAEEQNLEEVRRAAYELLNGSGDYQGAYDELTALKTEYEQNLESLQSQFESEVQLNQSMFDDGTISYDIEDRFQMDMDTGDSMYQKWLREKSIPDDGVNFNRFAGEEGAKFIFQKYLDKLSTENLSSQQAMTLAYQERFKELQQDITKYETAVGMTENMLTGDFFSKDRLASDYMEVDAVHKENIETYKKKLQEYKEKLETENKTLIEKEVQSRSDIEKALKDLKEAKTISSVKQAEAHLRALETASNKYYQTEEQRATVGLNNINDIGLLGPFNIDIKFAEEYTITIVDAFLTSRGSMIQIDENAIVEEYSFFARDIKYT